MTMNYNKRKITASEYYLYDKLQLTVGTRQKITLQSTYLHVALQDKNQL